MKKLLRIYLLMGLLLSLIPFSAAQAQSSPAVIGFSPQSTTLGVDGEGQIAVVIQNVTGLYAFDITLRYDPSAIEVVDADASLAGVQVSQGTFLDGGMVVKNQVDSAAGVVSYVMT